MVKLMTISYNTNEKINFWSVLKVLTNILNSDLTVFYDSGRDNERS